MEIEWISLVLGELRRISSRNNFHGPGTIGLDFKAIKRIKNGQRWDLGVKPWSKLERYTHYPEFDQLFLIVSKFSRFYMSFLECFFFSFQLR